MAWIDPELVAFAGLVGLLTVAPGPDLALTVRNALRSGRLGAVVTAAGIAAGLLVHGTVWALGLAAILAESAAAFAWVRRAGAVVLVGLGVWTLLTAGDEEDPARDADGDGLGHAAASGFVTNVLNPKVAVFYVAVLPGFVEGADPLLSAWTLSGIHALLSLAWFPLVGGAVRLAEGLVERAGAWLERAAGGALVAFGARLAVDDLLV